METTRVSRVSPSESKASPKLPIKKAAVAFGLASPLIVLGVGGCTPPPEIQMIPTPDFLAQQTENKPIRVVSEDLNTIPQSTRQAIETKFKDSITQALIFDVTQKNTEGYIIDENQNNAPEISFDLYTLSSGKIVGTFPSENGTVMTEVIGVDEITSDGYVYRTLKTIVNNNGKDEKYVFISFGYGQIKTAKNIPSLDETEQRALAQSQIEKNQVESVIFGNPFLPSPNAIVWIKDENFQGEEDLTFTDSLKDIKYKAGFIPTRPVTSSTNTPKPSTGTPSPTSTFTEAPLPTKTTTPTSTATGASTVTIPPTEAPTATAIPKPGWQTTMETQDTQDKFFKVVDGKPVIDLYGTQVKESIILNENAIKITETTDGLNPKIITGKDTQGSLYAFNPDYGWFKVPAEIQMDYNKYKEYTELPFRYFGDGTANIINSLKYAENPTISPNAINPVYWVGYNDFRQVLTLCLNACGMRIGHYNKYPEELKKMRYNADTKPFAWTGFYKVHLDNGKTIYVVDRTLKNPTETDKNQTINLFYGFDEATYKNMTIEDAGPGRSPLVRFLEKTDNGSYDFVTILPPPEPFPFNPNTARLMGDPNPVVGSLQQRGQLISFFDQDVNQIIMKLLNMQLEKATIFPLSQPLPAGLSKYILFTTSINT